MSQVKVTVFIPAYNYARYLTDCIDSILMQSYKDYEILIADNASKDNTQEICESYEKRDKRIRYVRHTTNLGMVENWNWCLKQARGEYLKPMCADDGFCHPDALERLVTEIQSSSVALVCSARKLINANSKEIGINMGFGGKTRLISGKTALNQCLLDQSNYVGEPSAVLFRKADAKRGFDSTYRQLVDLEMWIYLLSTKDLSYIADPLCVFRKHSEQMTESNKQSNCHWVELVMLWKSYGNNASQKRDLLCKHAGKPLKLSNEFGNYISELKQQTRFREQILHKCVGKYRRIRFKAHKLIQKRTPTPEPPCANNVININE